MKKYGYAGVSDLDELYMYKIAEVTSQLDMCLRTMSYKDEETYKIITKIFNNLNKIISPILVEDYKNVNIENLTKNKLYREF